MKTILEHILVIIGKDRFSNSERENIDFVQHNPLINALLNDIEQYPHAYVLACLMDRQISAEKAWSIPYKVKNELKSFEISVLGTLPLEFYQNLFVTKSFHRFNKDMGEVFYSAIHTIQENYCGDASGIWAGNPSSATVVYRFLQFKGCGIKIATMTTNILARSFKIPLSDYYSIDISPDVHVNRVLKRTGLVHPDSSREAIIYKAREINPEFPGIIDFSCWEIGRTYCKPTNPHCSECPLSSECKKNL
ncbi:hypothetical protein [Sphaerochaeta sp. PS]|uniref:hypothetical protein n=1 Tax=Sphaerochaeta sp. PS TaxID=3076336 RepID=UPI0028A564D1|nr:hypothetical protein [Sphaerochaeta sp. PS]MDT4761145.1 hypothetical protein [Sphaerochaeta sp. PS]